jgi:hypothetical protein
MVQNHLTKFSLNSLTTKYKYVPATNTTQVVDQTIGLRFTKLSTIKVVSFSRVLNWKSTGQRQRKQSLVNIAHGKTG